MSLFSEKGYTLIETMIVLAIVGVMTALGVENFAAQIPHYNLNDAGLQIISDLRLIRQKAVAEGTSNTIQFDPDSKKYILLGLGERFLPSHVQYGAAVNVNKTVGGSLTRPDVDGISFSNNKATFGPNGVIAAGGTIYLTNKSESLAVTVNLTGRIKLHRWSGNDWE